MAAKETLKQSLLDANLEDFVEAAGGDIASWSRWLSGSRDIRASSLLEPARRLGMSPGELLDIILEQRRQRLKDKLKDLKTQIALLPDGDRSLVKNLPEPPH